MGMGGRKRSWRGRKRGEEDEKKKKKIKENKNEAKEAKRNQTEILLNVLLIHPQMTLKLRENGGTERFV